MKVDDNMKIAVTSRGKELTSPPDPRFGRCGYFLIVDLDTRDLEVVENESSMASGGAGPQAAQTISEAGAEVLITGNVGPNAFRALRVAGIEVFIGEAESVEELIERYGKGDLERIDDASVASHSGMR